MVVVVVRHHKGNAGGAGVPTNTDLVLVVAVVLAVRTETELLPFGLVVLEVNPATFQNPLSIPGSDGGGLGMPGPTSTNVAGGTGKFWLG